MRMNVFTFKFHILRGTASKSKTFNAEDITVWLSMIKEMYIDSAITIVVNVETEHMNMSMNQK